MNTSDNKPKRADYRKVLDSPLSETKRKIAVSMLDAKDTKELQEDSGASMKYIHQSVGMQDAMLASAAKMLKTRVELDKMLDKLDDLLSRDSGEELKPRDVLAALRLRAEVTNLLGKESKDVNINIEVSDLREATEEQLLQELRQIEERKRNVIDVTPIDTPK